jgi:predicted secreted protein
MKWTSAIAIYFIIWWTCLFVMLPLRIKNAAEAGEGVEEGNDAGAPVAHGLLWKAGATTVLATIVFAAVYWALSTGVLETMELPLIRDLPKI